MPEKNGTIVDAKGRQKRSWKYINAALGIGVFDQECRAAFAFRRQLPIPEYAIRCHKDGKRKFTHKLTKHDALMFKRTAQHLVKYLTEEYGV